MAGPLEDDRVEPDHANEEQRHRHQQEHHAERDERRRQEFHDHVDHRSTSRITSLAWLKSPRRTLRRYAGSARGPLRLRSLSCSASRSSGSTSPCGFQRFDFDRTLRLDDLLIRRRVRQADFRRHMVVRGVDRCERRLDLGRRVDLGDERSVERDAVARRRRSALLIHVIVEVAQVLSQVVDRDAAHQGRVGRLAVAWIGRGRRFEVRDPLAQDRDEVAHHVRDRVLDAEQIRVEIALRHLVADLAGQAGVQLVFGHSLENRAAVVCLRRLRVVGHVERARGNRDLVHTLPRPFEIRPARRDHAQLRIPVPLALVGTQPLRDRIVQRGLVAEPLRATEHGLYRPFVLVDGVEAGEQIPDDEPRDEADHDAEAHRHARILQRMPPQTATTAAGGGGKSFTMQGRDAIKAQGSGSGSSKIFELHARRSCLSPEP